VQISPVSCHRANPSSLQPLCKSLQSPVTVQILPASSHCANLSSLLSLCKSFQPPATVQISPTSCHFLSDPNILVTLLNGC
jgi:hypothetical protein